MDYKAKEILLRAKKDVFSGNLGNYLSIFQGDGLDFREIREYEYGDDIRKINWNASAKSNTLKTNVFNEERELNVVIAFMLSGSLHFGSINLKQDIASEIIALLSFSALKGGNRLLSMFFDTQSVKFFEPSKRESVVHDIVTHAVDIDTIGKSVDYQAFCEFVNGVIKKRSLIFMVGDFYGDIDLSTISHQNEIYALIVRDRLEEYPVVGSKINLVDPNTLKSKEITLNKSIANRYQKLIKEQDDKFVSHCNKHQITVGKIYTDENIYLRLSEILKG